jgi:hypothetical protein
MMMTKNNDNTVKKRKRQNNDSSSSSSNKKHRVLPPLSTLSREEKKENTKQQKRVEKRVKELTTNYTLAALKDLCAKYNIKISGTKVVVARRIIDHENLVNDSLISSNSKDREFKSYKHDWSSHEGCIRYFVGEYYYYSTQDESISYKLKLNYSSPIRFDNTVDTSTKQLTFEVMKLVTSYEEDNENSNVQEESLSGTWKLLRNKKLSDSRKKKRFSKPSLFDYSQFIVSLQFDYRYAGPSQLVIRLQRVSKHYLETSLQVNEFQTEETLQFIGRPDFLREYELSKLIKAGTDYNALYQEMFKRLSEYTPLESLITDGKHEIIGMYDSYFYNGNILFEQQRYEESFNYFSSGLYSWLDCIINICQNMSIDQEVTDDMANTIQTLQQAIQDTKSYYKSELIVPINNYHDKLKDICPSISYLLY